MIASGSFTVFADYFQFYLWDSKADPTAPVEYTEEDIERRIKTAPNVVAVQTIRNMDVPVEIEIHETDPGYELDKWDHAAECSLQVPSGNIQLHECTGRPIADFHVAIGDYRVRAFFGGLDDISHGGLHGNDRYKLVLWFAPYDKECVLKQWPT